MLLGVFGPAYCCGGAGGGWSGGDAEYWEYGGLCPGGCCCCCCCGVAIIIVPNGLLPETGGPNGLLPSIVLAKLPNVPTGRFSISLFWRPRGGKVAVESHLDWSTIGGSVFGTPRARLEGRMDGRTIDSHVLIHVHHLGFAE
jgi:hypothetical protein